MKRYYADEKTVLYHGEAADWPGDEPIDLVLTNPYGPLPAALRGKPMLLHQWVHRKAELAAWADVDAAALKLIGTWNDGREAFWCLNAEPKELDLSSFRPVAGGWYPLELPMELLQRFAFVGDTIWDGFMGRGTVGVATDLLGMKYVGVEALAAHLALAHDYMSLTDDYVIA